MNNKALAILIIAALGFFMAVLIFYSHIGSRQPGLDSPYLGHNAMAAFNAYYEAESQLLFLDNAAIISWKNSEKNLDKFKINLEKYFAAFNLIYYTDLSVNDYEFIIQDGYIKAKSQKELSIKSKWYTYSFNPNFKVKAEGVQPSQEETVSLT